MEDCLFCKIINKENPSTKVFENDYIYAFEDINPEAKVHVLVVPKKHIDSANLIDSGNVKYVSKIFLAIKEIAKIKDIYESGYRVITNCGEDGGQTVKHLHFHIIGGEKLPVNIK